MQGVDGKRIAALIGDGFEEAELNEPRRALEEAGAIVTIVGVDERSRQRVRYGAPSSARSTKPLPCIARCTLFWNEAS